MGHIFCSEQFFLSVDAMHQYAYIPFHKHVYYYSVNTKWSFLIKYFYAPKIGLWALC